MDEALEREIAVILATEDEDTQIKCITRVMFYLLTLPVPPRAYYPTMERFIQRAFEVLPSSSLPQQLAKKLGVGKCRRKVVSFSTPIFFDLRPSERLSNEGRIQQARESGSLGITNTDSLRRFNPRDHFTEGTDIQTRYISLLPRSLSNAFKPKPNASAKCSAKPSISLGEVLQNPSIMEMYNY